LQARERVRHTIAHQAVSPLPYRLKFAAPVAERLQAATGLPDVDRSLGNALAHVKMTPQAPPVQIEPATGQMDEFGCVWATGPDGAPYVVGHPLAQGDVRTYPFPDPCAPARFAEMARRTAIEQDRFVLFSFDWTLFERAHFMRGLEQFLTDMLLAPSLAHALLDRILAFNLVVIERACQLDVDGVILSDDYGTQRGLMMSPSHWRQFIRPRLQEEFEVIRRHDKAVFLHSCGDVSAILPDLVEIGLDVLHPVQPEVFDLAGLKAEYGSDLCFYGGISTQRTLPYGTPKDVEAEVRERISVLGRDGGYIIGPGIMVLADTPLENVVAFVEAVQQQVA
jgi:uroporphyrinogen decarboxylase